MRDALKNNLSYVGAIAALAAIGLYTIGTMISAALVNSQKKLILPLKSQLDRYAHSADTSKAALILATNDVMNGDIQVSAGAYARLRTEIGNNLCAADGYMNVITDTKMQVDSLFAAKDTAANWNLWGNVEKFAGNKVKLQKLALARSGTFLNARAVDDIRKMSQWRIQSALAAERKAQQASKTPACAPKPRSQLR